MEYTYTVKPFDSYNEWGEFATLPAAIDAGEDRYGHREFYVVVYKNGSLIGEWNIYEEAFRES